MRYLQEIKLVGFRDWCWWVFMLKRTEFHWRLNLQYDKKLRLKKSYKEVAALRARAQRIDMLIGGVA